MAYRGRLHFTTQSARYDYRIDPYASDRLRLPNCTHGVRYASTPKRTTRIKTYAPSTTVRPLRTSAHKRAKQPFKGSDLKRLLVAFVSIAAFAVFCAFIGIGITQGAIELLTDKDVSLSSSYENTSSTHVENISDPQSSWKQDSIPALYQSDPQWAKRPYGPGTIGSNGSVALCLAMVRIATTGDVSIGPVDIASYAQRSGFADPSNAKGLLVDGAAGVGLLAHPLEANEASIRSEIIAGRPVIAAVQSSSFEEHTTFIVLTDIDERGKLIVNDPISRERSRRHWSFAELITLADGLWSYTAVE